MDQITQKTRVRRRLCFFLLVCLLLAQSIFIVRVTEPYPAIWSPGFAGGNREKSYQKPVIRFKFADGKESITSRPKLLEQFPKSHQGEMMSFFKPIKATEQTRPSRIATVFPGYYKGHRHRLHHSKLIWHWFQEQSKRLFGRADVVLVQVEWNKYRIPDHVYLEQIGIYELSQQD